MCSASSGRRSAIASRNLYFSTCFGVSDLARVHVGRDDGDDAVADLVVGLEPAARAVEVVGRRGRRGGWTRPARDAIATPARPFAVAASCRMSHSLAEQGLEVLGRCPHLLQREDVDAPGGEPVAHALAVGGADAVDVDGATRSTHSNLAEPRRSRALDRRSAVSRRLGRARVQRPQPAGRRPCSAVTAIQRRRRGGSPGRRG